MQMGERALDKPELTAQSGAVPGASAGDQRFHPQPRTRRRYWSWSYPRVSKDGIGALSWTSALAPHGRHRFQKRNGLGDVGDQVVLTAPPAPVDRASSRFRDP